MSVRAGWLLGLVLALSAVEARAEPGGDVVLKEKGCLACHSTDGTPRQGPTLAGLSGRVRRVTTEGAARELVADHAYLRRSIVEPDADVVEGFPPGLMPKLSLSPGELSAVVDHIEALASVQPAPPPSPLGLLPLLICALSFTGLHFVLSSSSIRKSLVDRLGNNAFQGLYSLLIGLAMAGMVYFFTRAPYVELWMLPRAARWVPALLMPLSIFLMLAGYTTKSPTMAGVEGSAQAEGILRVTRHPALWGFTVWGLAHIPPNGDARSLIVFLSVIALSLGGMWHIDARRAASQGEAWQAFVARTSILPFFAIAQGRNHLSLREIGWARVLGALLIYVGILHTHHLSIGVRAIP